MGKKNQFKNTASNVSSAANPAASSSTHTASKSSILRSSFAPSQYQVSLFASVIQGLDSQHLRIHDTSTGRLRCEHAIAPKASITCLDWGYYGETHPDHHHQNFGKKRKRETNGTISELNKEVAVAFGTSDSEIQIFSPAEAKCVVILTGGHTSGIRDFKFAVNGQHGEGWSVGGDGKLVQWDLKNSKAIRYWSFRKPIRVTLTITGLYDSQQDQRTLCDLSDLPSYMLRMTHTSWIPSPINCRPLSMRPQILCIPL